MTLTASARITCLCGIISEPGSLLADSKFPITSSEVCYCDSCRYTTGSLGASFPPLKSAPSESAICNLTAYKARPIITDYFCSTCGSHVFAFNSRSGRWFCLGGVIELPELKAEERGSEMPKDVVRITEHDFVGDTIDGGLVPFFLNLNGRKIPTWSAGPKEDQPFDLSHEEALSLAAKALRDVPMPKEDDLLSAKCHCGGVDLLIKRANYENASEGHQDPSKYKALMCACRSCRLTTGVSLVPIALIPPEHVFNAVSASSPGISAPMSSAANLRIQILIQDKN